MQQHQPRNKIASLLIEQSDINQMTLCLHKIANFDMELHNNDHDNDVTKTRFILL